MRVRINSLLGGRLKLSAGFRKVFKLVGSTITHASTSQFMLLTYLHKQPVVKAGYKPTLSRHRDLRATLENFSPNFDAQMKNNSSSCSLRVIVGQRKIENSLLQSIFLMRNIRMNSSRQERRKVLEKVQSCCVDAKYSHFIKIRSRSTPAQFAMKTGNVGRVQLKWSFMIFATGLRWNEGKLISEPCS